MCIDFEGGVRRFYGNFAGCPVACDFARELAGGAWRRSPKSQNLRPERAKAAFTFLNFDFSTNFWGIVCCFCFLLG